MGDVEIKEQVVAVLKVVLFCAQCSEFPCDKVNESVYKKSTIKKWLDGNNEIKKYGIDAYYQRNRNRPHYIDYVKDND